MTKKTEKNSKKEFVARILGSLWKTERMLVEEWQEESSRILNENDLPVPKVHTAPPDPKMVKACDDAEKKAAAREKSVLGRMKTGLCKYLDSIVDGIVKVG